VRRGGGRDHRSRVRVLRGVIACPHQRAAHRSPAGWAGYKTAFIKPEGRVIDPTRGGIITSEGQTYALHNSAGDADSDTALALLFAAKRFGDGSYRTAALAVLSGIWHHEMVSIAGMNVVTTSLHQRLPMRHLTGAVLVIPLAFAATGVLHAMWGMRRACHTTWSGSFGALRFWIALSSPSAA
jgi:hypothetical protein